jgi:hypothetical protein
MFNEEISVKKLKEQIDVITDFNVLNKLLAKEQRKTGREIIKDRVNRLRIEKDGLINLVIFDSLVNKIPYGNRDYVRTSIPKEIQEPADTPACRNQPILS